MSFARGGTIRKSDAAVNLVVDTSVWSLVLRRPRLEEDHPLVRAFRRHVESGDGLFLIGNILQELLDGLRKAIRSSSTFLGPYPLLELTRSTYVAAA